MPAKATDVHLLTHTARMMMAVAAKPDHQGGPDYLAQVETYKLRWKGLTPAQRAEVAEAAHEIHDMTEPVVAAAVEALEA